MNVSGAGISRRPFELLDPNSPLKRCRGEKRSIFSSDQFQGTPKKRRETLECKISKIVYHSPERINSGIADLPFPTISEPEFKNYLKAKVSDFELSGKLFDYFYLSNKGVNWPRLAASSPAKAFLELFQSKQSKESKESEEIVKLYRQIRVGLKDSFPAVVHALGGSKIVLREQGADDALVKVDGVLPFRLHKHLLDEAGTIASGVKIFGRDKVAVSRCENFGENIRVRVNRLLNSYFLEESSDEALNEVIDIFVKTLAKFMQKCQGKCLEDMTLEQVCLDKQGFVRVVDISETVSTRGKLGSLLPRVIDQQAKMKRYNRNMFSIKGLKAPGNIPIATPALQMKNIIKKCCDHYKKQLDDVNSVGLKLSKFMDILDGLIGERVGITRQHGSSGAQGGDFDSYHLSFMEELMGLVEDNCAQSQSKPSETQSKPSETQSKPSETQSMPSETQSMPSETQVVSAVSS